MFSIEDAKFDMVASILLSRGWNRHQNATCVGDENGASDDDMEQRPLDLLWTNLAKVDFQVVFENNLIVNHMKGAQHMSNKVTPIRSSSSI